MVPYNRYNRHGDNDKKHLGAYLPQTPRKHGGVVRPASPSPSRLASDQLVIPSLNNYTSQEMNGFRSAAEEPVTDDDNWARNHPRSQKVRTKKHVYKPGNDQYDSEEDYAESQRLSRQTKRSDRDSCEIPNCIDCNDAEEVNARSTQRGPSTAKDEDEFWVLGSDGWIPESDYNAAHPRNHRRKHSPATRNGIMSNVNIDSFNFDDFLPRRRNKKSEDPCTCDDCLDNAERRLADRPATPRNETDNDAYFSEPNKVGHRRRDASGSSDERCICEDCVYNRIDKATNDSGFKSDYDDGDETYFTEDEGDSGPTDDEDFFVPDADVFETKNYHDIMVALPGCHLQDINVYFNNKEQKLIVWGTQMRNAHLPFVTTRIHSTERKIGKFRRNFRFDGEKIKKRDIQAEFRDGLLGIILKKNPKGRNAVERVEITQHNVENLN